MIEYPWYETTDSEVILQGDIINSCMLLIPPCSIEEGEETVDADLIEYEVIVMSQSCDLVQKKLELVLVCPVWPLSVFEERNKSFKSKKMKESLRRGQSAGYHLLNKCEIEGFQKEYMVVDFRSVYSVSFDYLSSLVQKSGRRIRLLSPYREHLSQAFARFFMRVGLPIDIPPFR